MKGLACKNGFNFPGPFKELSPLLKYSEQDTLLAMFFLKWMGVKSKKEEVK